MGPFRHPGRHVFILQFLGVFLSTVCLRKALWIFGDGKGMKSTVFSAIANCMGKFAVTLAKKVFFASGSESGHNTDLMRAEGKRLVLVDELDKDDRLRESTYKQYTAHEKISAREIYGGQGEWVPFGTAVLLTNTVPKMHFSDSSIPDRTAAVKGTTRVFSTCDEECKLPPGWHGESGWEDHFDEETDLFWVLRTPREAKWAESFRVIEDEGGHQNELGCLMVLLGHLTCKLLSNSKNGELIEADIISRDRAEFLKEADHIGQFVADMLYEEQGETTAFKDIWVEYKAWCIDKGIKSMEQKYLIQSLGQKSLMVKKRKVWHVKAIRKSSMMDNDSRL